MRIRFWLGFCLLAPVALVGAMWATVSLVWPQEDPWRREMRLGWDALARSKDTLARSDYSDAMDFFSAARRRVDDKAGAGNERLAETLRGQASAFLGANDFLDAEGCLVDLLGLQERTLGTDHPELEATLRQLGRVYGKLGDWRAAASAYERGFKLADEALGPPNHPYMKPYLQRMGWIYYKQGRYDEAEALFLRTMAILEQGYMEDRFLADCLWAYSFVLNATDRSEEAKAARKRAKAIYARRHRSPRLPL